MNMSFIEEMVRQYFRLSPYDLVKVSEAMDGYNAEITFDEPMEYVKVELAMEDEECKN
ncbi:hypothetical protein [Aedoeadaptatus coxii]|uniref:hypothetical protein n=1 Tax=Aedoeadaptatus coxii TaxID=755172 RepID=UPI002AD3E2D6|nr:hypothetical protein [Peptoniphilus coxii]